MNASRARGIQGLAAPQVVSGKVIRKKILCNDCNEYGKIKDGVYRVGYAVYTHGTGHLCRTCAKDRKVI